jgi:CBS-domain-containing membrane protein
MIMNGSVKDVMTRNVIGVRETAGFKDILVAMRPYGVSAFPVLDSADRVVGVVSEADLLLKEVGPGLALSRGERVKAAGMTAAELMSTPAITIGPDASVAEAAKIMYAHRVKRLPVVEDDGCLVGIISRVDVLSVFDRPDDQIGDDVRELIAEEFALNPNAFDVTVTSGVVTIIGQLGQRAIARDLIGTIRHVVGVVGVRHRVDYPPEDLPEIVGVW